MVDGVSFDAFTFVKIPSASAFDIIELLTPCSTRNASKVTDTAQPKIIGWAANERWLPVYTTPHSLWAVYVLENIVGRFQWRRVVIVRQI